MICPKCGTENKENYCIRCGAIVTDGVVYQISREEKPSIFDDLEIYIGPNSQKIINKNTNYAAGIFAPLYLIYRKCYLEGIILFTFEISMFYLYLFIVNKYLWFFPSIFGRLFRLFILVIHFLLYTIFTNSYYLHKSKKKIEHLKQQPNYQPNILAKAGGTNIIAVVLFISFLYLLFALWLKFH